MTYLRAEHTALDEIAYRRALAIHAVADSRLGSDLKGFLELFATTTGEYGDFEMPWGAELGIHVERTRRPHRVDHQRAGKR